MSELTGAPELRRRRRRADAQRSVAAILDAASRTLTQHPQASVEEIATAAGLTRQTVYAHFPSRDALLGALTDRATNRVTAALKDIDLSQGSASDALLRVVQLSWETFDREPFLLNMPGPPAESNRDEQRHQPVFAALDDLVRRGQREGDFDPSLPATWIIAATTALGHAAGEQVRAGRMSSSQASAVLRRALRRLFTT